MDTSNWRLLKDVHKDVMSKAKEAEWSGDFASADLLLKRAETIKFKIGLGEVYEVPF